MSPGVDLEQGAICWLAERALLIGVESSGQARSLSRALRQVLDAGIEVTPALRSVLIEAEGVLDPSIIEMISWFGGDPDDEMATEHCIEVVLDGVDLDEVCALTSTTPAQIGSLLDEVTVEVGAMGFSPGFAYLLGELGPLAKLGRRATPRPRVPPGSLATAAGQLALYPQASPGGWWLLGRSNASLFDPNRVPPALFAAGDRVRFDVVKTLAAPSDSAVTTPTMGPGVLRVLAVPPGTGVVDDGRRGHGAIGVGPSGPFDPERAGDLRRLLGGAPGVIELPAGGLELEVLAPCTVAGLGLEFDLDGRILPEGRPVQLSSGIVRVRAVRDGRGYLGLAGGPVLPKVLGSTSTSMLSGLGPGYLAVGDELVARHASGFQARASNWASAGELRVTLGPHASMLRAGPEVLEGLVVEIVEPSNRVGLRVHPACGPLDRVAGEVTSIPVVTGAVQLPPDGMPVILGPDRATLGGYPVVACVIGADLGRLGRCGIGDRVRLRVVSLDEARRVAPAEN